MRILFVASEAYPLAKVGGLADVVSSLALALQDLGHEICILLPKYGGIKASLEDLGKGFVVQFKGRAEWASLKKTMLKGKIPVYLVENGHHFGREQIYGGAELERFLFFSLTIPRILSLLDFAPDVIHCHDWHTALTFLWLKKARMELPSVFTIHNLAYQGSFDEQFLFSSGLSQTWQECIPAHAPKPKLNFLSQGILLANILTTVSPTYASEILTPEYGQGLEELLSYRRGDLYGILNGIDYEEYDPACDPYVERNYDSATIERKVENKLALQRKSGLEENSEIPLCGMVSRLEEQKGIDLLLQAIDSLFSETRLQLVILGQGREHYRRLLSQTALRHAGRMAVFIGSNESLARLIYAGSDLFLMPSRFEPCGLGQLIAMRYGAVPVVRHTGGLADTVKDAARGNGNGFVFHSYSVEEMLGAIKRAEEAFYHSNEWQNLVRKNMKLDFSWKASVRKYQELYLKAQKIARRG